MANTFKLKTKASIGTSPTTVYTVPASGVDSTVIIGLLLANIDTTTTDGVKGTVQIVTASTSGENANDPYLGKALPIPLASSLELMGGNKIVLEAGDVIKVTSDTASSIDVSLSIMEIS
jgi:hypothetical protein